MSHWPIVQPGASTRAAASCTTSATAHVKGAWATLLAETTYDVHSLLVYPYQVGIDHANTWVLLDIGICDPGSAGSEVVIIPNLMLSMITASRNLATGQQGGIHIPIYIPKGRKVVTRAQNSQAVARAVTLEVLFRSSGFAEEHGLGKWEAAGPNTATSRAVGIALPTSGTSAWSMLGTTGRLWRQMFLSFSPDLINTDYSGTFEIGVGAAGFEVSRLTQHMLLRPTSTGTTYQNVENQNFLGPYPVNLMPGTRLAWRATYSAGGTWTTSTAHLAAYGGS